MSLVSGDENHSLNVQVSSRQREYTQNSQEPRDVLFVCCRLDVKNPERTIREWEKRYE